LLNVGSPREILKTLIKTRYPIYGVADVIVDTGQEGLEATVNKVITGLNNAKDNLESEPAE